MSYILDALRKSERERQLGQPASLDRMIFSPDPASKRPWLPWVLGATAVVNVAALGYFLGLTSGGSEENRTIASRKAVNANAAMAPVAPKAALPETAPLATAQPPGVPVPPPPPPKPEGKVSAGVEPHQRAVPPLPFPGRPGVAPPMQPVPPIRPAEREVPDAETADGTEEDMAEEGTTDESDGMDEPEENTEPAAPAGAPRNPPQVATGETPEAPRKDTVPLLTEMPPAFQSRIPALKINLFAYSARPDERFVVINMARYPIGAVVGEGVRLERIDADSLTLSFEGQRFRLERP